MATCTDNSLFEAFDQKKSLSAKGFEYLTVSQIPNFWEVWKENKDAIKAQGFWVSKLDGEWFVFRKATVAPAPPAPPEPPFEPDPLPDALKGLLLQHQHDHTRYVLTGLRKFKRYLDTSGTGSGKTFIALASVRHFNEKTLAIVPAAVVRDWTRAANYLGISHLVDIVSLEKARNGSTQIEKIDKGKRGYQFRFPAEYKFLIFDEVHKCGGAKTLQSQIFIDALDTDCRILMLSATAADSPLKMRGLGYALNLFSRNTYQDWLKWCFDHGVVEGKYSLEFKKPMAFKKVHDAIFPKRSHRIPSAELMKAFPEGQVIAEAIVSDPKILAEYKHAIEMFINSPNRNNTGLMASRQISELAKIPHIIEQAQDFLEEGKAVVVFVNFLDSIASLEAHFRKKGVDYRVIRGGQTSEQRTSAIDDFQSDRVHLIFVVLQAGGTGISLHDLHGDFPRASIISPSYSAIDLIQALGRIHRAGGKTPVLQKVLYLADSIEEKMCQAVQQKLHCINTLNEGDVNPAIFCDEKGGSE